MNALNPINSKINNKSIDVNDKMVPLGKLVPAGKKTI